MMKIFRKILLIVIILVKANVLGQVGIGTIAPDGSAVLEISSNSKGLLIPRVSLTGTADVSTISNPKISLLIYNTTNDNNIKKGYYYWNGSNWQNLVDVPAKIIREGTNPTITNPVNAAAGDIFINTQTGNLFVFDGVNWIAQTTSVHIVTITIIATENQTQFTTPWDVSMNNTKIYRNGISISFTTVATNIFKIETAAICNANDEIKIFKYL
jgi:hypothetical protein